MGRLLRYSPLLILALAWEIISRLGLISSSALPPLSAVAVAWWELAKAGDLWNNAGPSLYRLGCGLALAIVAGALLGFAMAASRAVNTVLGSFVEVFYPVPKSALIPITALWLGFGDGSKILLIFLGCILPVTMGAYNGARSADLSLMWSARSMGASRLRMIRDVVVPSALPELLGGIRTALALSFVLLVSSELIVSRSGLGFLIGDLGGTGAYEYMFAVVLTVALIGFAADRLYQLAQRGLLAWREEEHAA